MKICPVKIIPDYRRGMALVFAIGLVTILGLAIFATSTRTRMLAQRSYELELELLSRIVTRSIAEIYVFKMVMFPQQCSLVIADSAAAVAAAAAAAETSPTAESISRLKDQFLSYLSNNPPTGTEINSILNPGVESVLKLLKVYHQPDEISFSYGIRNIDYESGNSDRLDEIFRFEVYFSLRSTRGFSRSYQETYRVRILRETAVN